MGGDQVGPPPLVRLGLDVGFVELDVRLVRGRRALSGLLDERRLPIEAHHPLRDGRERQREASRAAAHVEDPAPVERLAREEIEEAGAHTGGLQQARHARERPGYSTLKYLATSTPPRPSCSVLHCLAFYALSAALSWAMLADSGAGVSKVLARSAVSMPEATWRRRGVRTLQ